MPDIESPAKPWQGKLYHSRGSSDDWGTIRDERHDAIIRVPITLDEEKLVQHRRAGTDPTQQIVDEILNRLNAYKETKRQLDEAQNQLSQIYRWIERNHPDGFIDSLTYLQNLERVTDSWYDRIDGIEADARKLERERDELAALLASEKATRNSIIEKGVETERERDKALEKIKQQKLEIVRLNGATNHAGGTPLKIALRERDEAREALREIWQSGDAFLPHVDQETITRWRKAAGWEET